MIGGRWFEHGVRVEPFHRDLNHTQHEHVRSREPRESVEKEPDKFQTTGDEASGTLRKRLQVSFRIRSKVQKAHEEPAHEEERVDAERSVRDRLEEEFSFHDLSIFHVIGIFKRGDTGVAENHPGHRYRSQTVDGADRVASDLPVADDLHVCTNRKRQQQFLEHAYEQIRYRLFFPPNRVHSSHIVSSFKNDLFAYRICALRG